MGTPAKPAPEPPKAKLGRVVRVVRLQARPSRPPRQAPPGEYVATIEVLVTFEKEANVATQLTTAFAAVKTAYDTAVAGDAPPPAPTLNQIILASGQPAVFAGDQDDYNELNTLVQDATGSTLASYLSGAIPAQPGGSTAAGAASPAATK
jgi:hypothetical protein